MKISDFDRLNETHFFLSSSYALLMQYASSIGYITEKEANDLFASFFELLTALIKEQQVRVEQGASTSQDIKCGNEKHDCLYKLSKLFRSGSIHMASSPEKIKEADGYEAVIHRNCLCIRSTRFVTVLRNAGVNDDEKRVLQILESKGALVRENGGRLKIQISATGNKRFVAIPLNKV